MIHSSGSDINSHTVDLHQYQGENKSLYCCVLPINDCNITGFKVAASTSSLEKGMHHALESSLLP